jgi:histidinol-phosphate/aromatic aminotransferase/cobyric acid decarboxylase-like protein
MEDVHFAKESVARVAAWKGPLAEALGRIKGIRTFPPSANFVFGQITRGQGSVEDLQERLMARGILIRNCANFPGLDSTYFRVAVRTPEENARLVEAMTDAMEGT